MACSSCKHHVSGKIFGGGNDAENLQSPLCTNRTKGGREGKSTSRSNSDPRRLDKEFPLAFPISVVGDADSRHRGGI